MNKFENGMDISSLIELEQFGAKYRDFAGNSVELTKFLAESGFTSMRIRLWLDPYDENKKPYLGGTNDIDKALELALRAKENNLSIMLDIHYSDFWVDPAKQTLPKSWQNIKTFDELLNKVEEYTKDVLHIFKNHDIDLAYIQIGNEVTHGMLWPFAKIHNYNGLLVGNFHELHEILKTGLRVAKEIYPNAKRIIHLEKSGYTEIYDDYLTRLEEAKVDYDILGMSYYPYWHKDLKHLENTFKLVRDKFYKDFMVVEYSFCYSDKKIFDENNKELPLVIEEGKESAITNNVDYEFTVEGQEKFIMDLYKLIRQYGGLGMYYWEPAWVNVPGTSWASQEAMDYIGEHKNFGNEWANEGLFTSDGHPLNSLKIFKGIGGEKYE